MPDGAQRLADGIRYEAAGVLDRAMDEYAAAAESGAGGATVAEALRRLADVRRTRCDWDGAIAAARASGAAARAAGLVVLEAEALNAEAAVHQTVGAFELATPLYERMQALTADLRIHGIALQNLGSIAAQSGDLPGAERYFMESSRHFRAGGYERGVVIALNNYGRCLLDKGAAADAEPVLVDALQAALEAGDLDLVALARMNYAESLLARRDADRAETLGSAALGYYAVTGNAWRRVECMRLLGDVALVRDQPDHARTLFEAALRLAEEVGVRVEIELLQRRLSELPGAQPAG